MAYWTTDVLTNVPVGTATVLSYSMLMVVAIFLVSGPLIVYYYYRKTRREKTSGSGIPPSEDSNKPINSG